MSAGLVHGHRATYRGSGPYEGVVKDASGKVVATCGHLHRNRDQSTMFAGPSARSCALELLNEVTGDPKAAAKQQYPWMFQGGDR